MIRRSGVSSTWLILPLLLIAAPPDRAFAQLTCAQADVKTHVLRYCSAGSGPVTVVFEAGMQSDSRTWRAVAPRIAESARVLIYDRAGLGGSGAGPLPRTSLQIARELKALLLATGHDGPLILVGHSAGGWHVRAFAAEYPAQVRGLLLLDSPHEEFDERRDATLDPGERKEREDMLQAMRAALPEGLAGSTRGWTRIRVPCGCARCLSFR